MTLGYFANHLVLEHVLEELLLVLIAATKPGDVSLLPSFTSTSSMKLEAERSGGGSNFGDRVATLARELFEAHHATSGGA